MCRQLLAHDDRGHDAGAVDVGHLVVHERDVGTLLRRITSIASPPIGRFADHLDAAVLDESSADTIAEERMVVRDHHSHPLLARGHRSSLTDAGSA